MHLSSSSSNALDSGPSTPKCCQKAHMRGKTARRFSCCGISNEMSCEDIMSLRQESFSHVDEATAKLRPNLSFSGCGFNGIYHIGVCAAILEYAPHLYEDNVISGTSAGSIAAVCLACNVSIKKCCETVMEVISACKRDGMIFSKFNLNLHLQHALRELLPDDAHIKCSGRLHISVTKLDYSEGFYSLKNLILSEFASKEELITAVMCSSFIPMVSGFYFPTINGVPMMDGGFSDNQPEINDATITVTPFAAEADICPIDSSAHQSLFNMYNTKVKFNFFNCERFANLVFPNSSARMHRLLCLGYDDCVRYLLLRKFVMCDHHSDMFKTSLVNMSDSCDACHELVLRAGASHVPSYLADMIYEKEPATYSYWGAVLDNRVTAGLFALAEAGTELSDLDFWKLCESLDLMGCLENIPFFGGILKRLRAQMWVLRTVAMLRGGRRKPPALEEEKENSQCSQISRCSTFASDMEPEPSANCPNDSGIEDANAGPTSSVICGDLPPVFCLPDDEDELPPKENEDRAVMRKVLGDCLSSGDRACLCELERKRTTSSACLDNDSSLFSMDT